MKTFWTKLNYLLRGEAFLHFVTMFTILVLVMQVSLLFGIYLPIWVLAIIPVIVAILWEIVGKIFEEKPVNVSDIFWTLVGGFIVILIFRF